jgi:hypothetical protein
MAILSIGIAAPAVARDGDVITLEYITVRHIATSGIRLRNFHKTWRAMVSEASIIQESAERTLTFTRPPTDRSADLTE